MFCLDVTCLYISCAARERPEKNVWVGLGFDPRPHGEPQIEPSPRPKSHPACRSRLWTLRQLKAMQQLQEPVTRPSTGKAGDQGYSEVFDDAFLRCSVRLCRHLLLWFLDYIQD